MFGIYFPAHQEYVYIKIKIIKQEYNIITNASQFLEVWAVAGFGVTL